MSGAEAPAKPTRFVALDRLRALAVVVMIEVHVVNALLAPEYRATERFRALDYANGLVAPTFLFCAGYACAALPQRPFSRDLRRSAVLLALGYLLHASGALRGDWAGVMQVDILQVIALSLLVVSVISRLFSAGSSVMLGLLALAIAGAWPIVSAADTSALPSFVRPYVSQAVTSQFPLFPWMAFALGGAAVARLRMTRLAGLAVGLIALGLVAARIGTDGATHDIAGMLTRFAFAPAALASLSLFDRTTTKADPALDLFARRSLLVYYAHIIVVYGTHPLSLRSVIGPHFGPIACVATWLVVTAAMALLAWKAPRVKLY